MSTILAIARKDLLLLARNRGALFFTFAWPLIVSLFFGTVFATPTGSTAITVMVVDEDHGANAAALVGRLRTTKGLQVEVAGRAAAMDAIKHGKRPAAIVIPAGYSEAADRMFYGAPPRLELAVDPARQAEAAMLEGMLTGAAAQGMQDLFSNTPRSKALIDRALQDAQSTPDVAGRDDLTHFLGELKTFVGRAEVPAADGPAQAQEGAGWKPVEVVKSDVAQEREGPRNAYDVTFPQGVLWGMIGCAFGFAVSLVIERTHGTLTRLQMSPVSRTTVLAGKALACFTAIVIVQVMLFGVARAMFGVRPGSFPLLVVACLALGVAFVGIMMVISVMGKTEQTVGGLAWAVLLPMSMLGGGMVPLFAMPPWMQAASNISPIKWGILALEGAIWRGFTLADMALPCGILLAVGVVGFTVGARVFRDAV